MIHIPDDTPVNAETLHHYVTHDTGDPRTRLLRLKDWAAAQLAPKAAPVEAKAEKPKKSSRKAA